jgi:hypothetical protein
MADLTEADRTVRLDTAALEILRPDAGPGLALAAPDRPLGVVTAASRLALDRAVTTAVEGEGDAAYLVATVVDVRRGTIEREGRLRLAGGAPASGGLEALAALVATGRSSPLLAAPPSLAVAAPPAGAPVPLAPPPPRVRSRGALVTGVASALAAATTLYFAREASGHYADARAMLDASGQVPPGSSVVEYNAAIREGDQSRAVAVAAGVAAGVGIVMTVILGRAEGRPGEPAAIRF